MKDDLKTRCEKSFYSELYHFDETSQDLVIDKTTGRVMLRKVLDVYEISVFEWLKNNSNIHIPAIYSFYEEENKLTVLEEYIQGDTLDSILKKVNIDFQEKLRIIFDICDALIFLHSAPVPIIHRDIKASNVMLTNDRIVKLIDFDASKTFHPGKNVDTTLIGTVGSAAPEQYGFRQSDTRTDIYSLGILIKELFPDDPRFDWIIDKATQLEPKLRYQSVSEMKTSIEEGIQSKKTNRFPFIAVILFLAAGLFSVGFLAFRSIAKKAEGTINNNTSYAQEISKETASKYESPENSAHNTELPDKSEIISGTGNNANASDKLKELSIGESCWYTINDSYSNGVYIIYAATISNSGSTPIEYPGIRVTAKNDDNIVLGTDDMVGKCIMPGDTIILGNQISASNCNPTDIADVNFVIYNGDPEPTLKAATSNDFIISGVNEHSDALFPNITGEITSKYQENLSTVSITAVFRNKNKLVAAETDYINDLQTGIPTAFQINISGELPEYDSVEIMAKTW